jgi:hypothetical protein
LWLKPVEELVVEPCFQSLAEAEFKCWWLKPVQELVAETSSGVGGQSLLRAWWPKPVVVNGQSLLRSWWPRPAEKFVADACFSHWLKLSLSVDG